MEPSSRKKEQGVMYAANPRLCIPVGGSTASSQPAPFLPHRTEPKRSAKVDHMQVDDESENASKEKQKLEQCQQRHELPTRQQPYQLPKRQQHHQLPKRQQRHLWNQCHRQKYRRKNFNQKNLNSWKE